MKQRGRKSTATLAIASPASDLDQARQRPPAPNDLSDPEKVIWRRVVAAMPAGWFQPEHRDTLSAYCRHATRSVQFNEMASAFTPADVGEKIDLEDLDRIARMADRETRAALALARSMRLTHQAQIRAEKAGKEREKENGESKPWE